MDCYPTTIGQGFLLWLRTITSNEAKMLPLKISVLSLEACYVWVYPPSSNGNGFINFASKFNQVYCLVPHDYWQSWIALDSYLVTSNEAKMFPHKMTVLILEIVFS